VPLQLGEFVGESWGGRIVEAPLVFKARVPAMGCAVYRVGDAPVAERPAAPPKDTLDNGTLRLRCAGRGLQEVTDLANGLVWRAPLASCIGDCRLYEMGPGILHVGPITGELSGQTGQGKWVLTGPFRWVYRWECTFHGQRVRQDVIIDNGARHIDFLTRVFCPGANGFFALCFDLPFHGRVDVDIPFGVEPRQLDAEAYAMRLPEGFQNIERHRENQFWARSWASFADDTHGVALITVDGDKYWTYDPATGRVRHILFTPLTDAESGWEAWVTKDRMALGWHEFRHRLVFHDGDWRAADLCGVSDRVRLPLQAVKPLGEGRMRAVATAPGLKIAPESVRLSAFHEVADGVVLRVYESTGEPANVRVELPGTFGCAVRTDFNLAPVDAKVKLAGRTLTLALRPWEIATVRLTR
jgi:alpha-mannosidase